MAKKVPVWRRVFPDTCLRQWMDRRSAVFHDFRFRHFYDAGTMPGFYSVHGETVGATVSGHACVFATYIFLDKVFS